MSKTGKHLFDGAMKTWGGSLITVLLVAGIVVCIEMIAYNHARQIDLTPSKTYSLSGHTIKLLSSLDQDVIFTAV